MTSFSPTHLNTANADAMPIGELLMQGGWAMYPIYACSVLVVGLFVQKLVELRAARLRQVRWAEAVIEQVREGELAQAEEACRHSPHPGARVLAAVIAALRDNPTHAEAEARRVGNLELRGLERNLGMLSFLAQVSPLLGLLGTVLGMVDLFMDLQGADQGQLAIGDLASGIWQALLTTAAGLTVAVPALAAHTWLTSQVDNVRLQLGDMVQRLLFAAEAQEEGAPE